MNLDNLSKNELIQEMYKLHAVKTELLQTLQFTRQFIIQEMNCSNEVNQKFFKMLDISIARAEAQP